MSLSSLPSAMTARARRTSVLITGATWLLTSCLMPDVRVSPAAPAAGRGAMAGAGSGSVAAGAAAGPAQDRLDSGIRMVDEDGGAPSQAGTGSLPTRGGSGGMRGMAGAGGQSGQTTNPCLIDNGGCDTSPKATCTSQGAAVTCLCPAGYEGNGVGPSGCSDIDECSKDNGGCDTSPKATCLNLVGAPATCMCPAGSTGNGHGSAGCSDITANTSMACGKFTCERDVVRDPATGLTWQRNLPAEYNVCGAIELCTADEALVYCADLGTAGGNWRLPSIDELTSIVDKSRSDPAIDLTAFPNTPPKAFWSSTTYGTGTSVWYYDFGLTGGSGFSNASSVGRVRCVR